MRNIDAFVFCTFPWVGCNTVKMFSGLFLFVNMSDNLWCYADEELVGHMTVVAEWCHPITMAGTAMVKWFTLGFDQ